jgi:hypothetical protein
MKHSYLFLLLALVACSNVNEAPSTGAPAPGVVCTMEARAGITVDPVDSATGAPLSGPTVLIVSEGAFADTVRANIGTPPAPTSISAAYERPGTYNIVVRHPGYRDFGQTSVVVTKDVCHVQPVRITARLERTG